MKSTDSSVMNEKSTVTNRRWRPRLLSPITSIILLIAMINLGLYALSFLFGYLDVEPKHDLVVFLYDNDLTFLGVGILALVLGILNETISRLRIPPVSWRVKQELIRALCDLGLLNKNDTTYWRGAFWVAPVGRWNPKAKCYELLFDIRNVKATEEHFKNMEQSIAGFARSQDASIEHWKIKNNRQGFKLTLWYTDDPYRKTLDEINPFN